ncbi:MAG: NUDIX domain-containing protein [Bacillaceae bacterium]|nr:NUDIX domain-containing protein [Bacillaceae bacterium]
MKHRIRVAAIIIQGDSILLVKHVHPQTGFEWWIPPGGGVEEEDHNIFETARREVWEETGLRVNVKENICFISEFEDEEYHTLNLEVFVEADVIDGELTIDHIDGKGMDEHFIKEVKWIPRDKLNDIIVFPDIIKKSSFWEERGKRAAYLGRRSNRNRL